MSLSRLNLVHLDAVEDEIRMGDFSAGHISSLEGAQLVQVLQDESVGGNSIFTRVSVTAISWSGRTGPMIWT